MLGCQVSGIASVCIGKKMKRSKEPKIGSQVSESLQVTMGEENTAFGLFAVQECHSDALPLDLPTQPANKVHRQYHVECRSLMGVGDFLPTLLFHLFPIWPIKKEKWTKLATKQYEMTE